MVLEKEAAIATHQTGHNSGVIHSGIYYRPGSLKARNCVEGGRALMAFCDENGIDYELCGKVIVPRTSASLAALDELHRRGTANGVPGLRMIGPEELREIEPYANGNPRPPLAQHRHHRLRTGGSRVRQPLQRQWRRGAHGRARRVHSPRGRPSCTWRRPGARSPLATSSLAGLYSDAVARMMGVEQDVRIVPFRGEYYMLAPEAEHMVKGLIYPVPNPEFPFLGVHFTRTVHGEVEAGPNAVLAFAREGYRMTPRQPQGDAGHAGLSRLLEHVRRYWKMGMLEMYRSLSKGGVREVAPEAGAGDSRRTPGARERRRTRAGGGAQRPTHDDFHVTETPNAVHVRNAPSPGATASLAIGRDVVAAAAKAFGLG